MEIKCYVTHTFSLHFPNVHITEQISATITPIGKRGLNITIDNAVNADTPPREMIISTRKGGVNATTEWEILGTFGWPTTKSSFLNDLTPGTLYGIKIIGLNNNVSKMESLFMEDVFIPAIGEAISH